MTEMVDRVARAIAEQQAQAWVYTSAADMCRPEALQQTKDALLAAARAAIKAMREPTYEMVNALDDGDEIHSLEHGWRMAIDAALIDKRTVGPK